MSFQSPSPQRNSLLCIAHNHSQDSAHKLESRHILVCQYLYLELWCLLQFCHSRAFKFRVRGGLDLPLVKHGGEARSSGHAWNWTSVRTGGDGSCQQPEGRSRAKLPLTVLAQHEVSFNQPSPTGFQRGRLAAFHFRGVTYLGGLKNVLATFQEKPSLLLWACVQA